MQYSDEAGSDPMAGETGNLSNQDSKKAYIIQSFTVKRILIEGVTFSTVEFCSKARTFSRSVISEIQTESYSEDNEESFNTVYEKNGINGMIKEDTSAKNILDDYRHIVLFGKISSAQEVCYHIQDTNRKKQILYRFTNISSTILLFFSFWILVSLKKITFRTCHL